MIPKIKGITVKKTIGPWGWLLLACVLLGTFLRFQNLDKKSLWADELFTLSMAYHHPLWPEEGQPFFERKTIFDLNEGDTFLTAKAAEQSPPLNDLAEKLTVHLLGPGEWAARLPAALSSVVLLCWFAAFAWMHADGYVQRVLGWATLLLALSPILVLYAKDGRAYSMGASLVGMAALLWMLRWRKGSESWQAPSWGECMLWILACYSHYNAALIPILLLSFDAWQAVRSKSVQAWSKLLTVGGVFALWIWLNMHTIFFTTDGGVAWQGHGKNFSFESIVSSGMVVIDRYWLLTVCFILLGLLIFRVLNQANVALNDFIWFKQVIFLWAVCTLFMLMAGAIVAKAGMMHPRYFIFMVPLGITSMALVLSQMTSRWVVSIMIIVMIVAAIPSLEFARKLKNEDFRGASHLALEGFGPHSALLYPWGPNERIYRIYLEKMAGPDIRHKMTAISNKADAPLVCDKLSSFDHVAIVAHDSGRPLIDEVYHHCQRLWPVREHLQLHNVYAEHWRKP